MQQQTRDWPASKPQLRKHWPRSICCWPAKAERMAQVSININGHNYRIAARDGDEARIEKLGADLAARANRLTKSLGVVSEAQTLAMVALMLADELADARAGVAPAVADANASAATATALDLAQLRGIVERLEAISRS